MKLVADTSVILDFLDGEIEDPFAIIRPYQMILLSPVAFHEVLRAYPDEVQDSLKEALISELLPTPTLSHWIESAGILRALYPYRRQKGVARMQNDVLIALAARDIRAPIWSRDSDFKLVCDHLGVGLFAEN